MLRVAEQQDPVLRDEALGSRAAWNQRQWSLLLHLRAMQLTRAVQGQWQSEANHRLLAQFESSGVGPSWDPDELHWCPVFPTTLQCKEPNTVKQLHALADATSDLFLSQVRSCYSLQPLFPQSTTTACCSPSAGRHGPLPRSRSRCCMPLAVCHGDRQPCWVARRPPREGGPLPIACSRAGAPPGQPRQKGVQKCRRWHINDKHTMSQVLPHNVLDTPLHALSPGAFTADLLVVSGLLDNRCVPRKWLILEGCSQPMKSTQAAAQRCAPCSAPRSPCCPSKHPCVAPHAHHACAAARHARAHRCTI